ncbi:MAG: 3-isopropylmalate dehydratase small subunit [Pseudomonadota bacterium]
MKSDPFLQHVGIAASMVRDNIDTDQIIPSREMTTVSRNGLADGLFAGWRYIDPVTRTKDPDFVLNQPENAGATILISGENFGCGSSREHAVWALKEYGIRAIIAKSFGEIFHGNCIRNGILPIVLSADQIEQMASFEPPLEVAIDLPNQTVSCDRIPGSALYFSISAFAKRLLTEGLDPIELTLTHCAEIEAFFDQDRQDRPWVYSAA